MVLYNFLRSESASEKIYFSPNLVDFDNMCGAAVPGKWRKDVYSGTWLDLEPSTRRNSTKEAKDVRQDFKWLLMNERRVPWQWKAGQVDVLKKRFKNMRYFIRSITTFLYQNIF